MEHTEGSIAPKRTETARISHDRLSQLDRYWRAANYLTIGQIYLQENPLLREPLRPEHIKPRLLGHWGTSPGLSFIYVHLNRLIQDTDANVIYLTGPGHGGPAIVANVYLEGTYSEIYPRCVAGHGGPAPSLPPVLDAGRHPEPRQRPRPPARFTRAANSATSSRMPSAPSSITRTSSPSPSSGMARRRRDRSKAPGKASSFSTRSAMAPCCPSST